MRRNFIDQADLSAEIGKLTANISPQLQPFSRPLRRLFHRHLPELSIGMRALPTPEDPAWAHQKVAAGDQLYRLGQRGLFEARQAMTGLIVALEEAALISIVSHGVV